MKDNEHERVDGRSGWRTTQRLGLWWILPLGFVVGLVVLVQGNIRQGGYVIAATLGLAAVLRLLLSRDAVGGLMVRSRAWDVLILLGLAVGAAVISASLVLPGTPVIP